MKTCFEICCSRNIGEEHWKININEIKLITENNCGWSDSLVQDVKLFGFRFLYGDFYKKVFKPKENNTYPKKEIMGFIIDLNFNYENSKFNDRRIDYLYLTNFVAPSIRNLKIERIFKN